MAIGGNSAGVNQLITIGEAARRTGVHPDTLRNWDRSGRLPARPHPLNGYRLYSTATIEDILHLVSGSGKGELGNG